MAKYRKNNNFYINKFNNLVKAGDTIYSRSKKDSDKPLRSIVIGEGDNWTPMNSEDSKYRRMLPFGQFVSDKRNEIISVIDNKPVLLTECIENGGGNRKKYQLHLVNKRKRNLSLYNIQSNVFGTYYYGKAKPLVEECGMDAYSRKGSHKLGVNTHHMNADNDAEIECVTNRAHTVIDTYKTIKDKNNIAAVNKFIQKHLIPLAMDEAPDKFTIFITERGETQKDRLFNYQALFESDEIVLKEEAVQELKIALKSAIIEYDIHHIMDQYVTYMMIKDPDFFYTKRYVLICDRPNNRAYTFSIMIDGKKKAKKKIRFNCTLMDIRECTLADGTISIHNMIDTDYFDGKTVALCQHDLSKRVQYIDLPIRKNGAA